MMRVSATLLFAGAALAALAWASPDGREAPTPQPAPAFDQVAAVPWASPSSASGDFKLCAATPAATVRFAVAHAAQEPEPPQPQPPAPQPPAPLPPLQISGETRYKPHSLVRLKAVGIPDRAGVIWRVYPKKLVQRATTHNHVLEFAAPPGAYEVELFVISQGADGGIVPTEAGATVVIESCHPPEPQPPQPGPNPPNPNPPQPNPPNPAPPNPAPPGGGRLDPSNAIGRIQFGQAGCSATVIAPQRADGRWDVLTAAHCVSSVGQAGTMKMPSSGKVHAVRVKAFDRASDIAWLETVEAVNDIEYAVLAKANPAVGVPVWHQGYGFDKPRNREDGVVTANENAAGQIKFTLNVSSGDSGGGIFRADTNEVVSSVCCTRIIAQKTDMYGGSTSQAIRLRPRGSTFELEWQPIQIPRAP